MKHIKLEKMNNGKDYGYVGQLTGTVYYSGTRFSCTWWQAQRNGECDNRAWMETEEKTRASLSKETKDAMDEAYNQSDR